MTLFNVEIRRTTTAIFRVEGDSIADVRSRLEVLSPAHVWTDFEPARTVSDEIWINTIQPVKTAEP